jgi:hypothetical protein
MALVYLALEDYTRALECYDKSHAIFLRAYGAGSIELAGLLCMIAECYRQQRDLTRSLALCVSFSSAQPSFVIIFTFFSVHLAQPIGWSRSLYRWLWTDPVCRPSVLQI